ncbi:MAG TPA: 50S ribosomal protein L4 [Gammaproteobacteria bacterium]|nr:50S ribosomal protein L4 [Gammaproteobacteria bacterium]
MQLAITGADGKSNGEVQIAEELAATEFNSGLVHQLVTAYLANRRGDTVGGKSRSMVTGTGAKPWRQKGTGRARAGTVKSPLWRGGGKTFVADDRHHRQKVNRKMHRAGMRSIVAELIRQGRVVVVDSLAPETPKTGEFFKQLKAWGFGQGSMLLMDDDIHDNLLLASRNIPKVTAQSLNEINPVDLVGNDQVVITASALKTLEERLQ